MDTSAKAAIRGKFGSDGVAAWFDFLEMLYDSNGDTYDATEECDWEVLGVIMHMNGDQLYDFFDFLSSIGVIDPKRWTKKRHIKLRIQIDETKKWLFKV